MMVSNKNIDGNNMITWIKATARPPSPSPPTPDARGTIVTTQIVMTTTMHPAVAAQILAETTRALKIVGGTTRGTGTTTQCHTTTNKWRVGQEVEPPAERWREATGQHNNQPNKRDVMDNKRGTCKLKDLARRRGQQIRGAADESSNRNRDSLLQVVLLCVTSFTLF